MADLGPEDSNTEGRDGESRDRFFESLWQANYTALVAFVRSRAPGLDAEDVVANVFESAYRAHKNGRGPGENARAYLYSATRRQMARAIDISDRSVPFDATETPLDLREDSPGLEHENEQVLIAAMNHLSASDRALLMGVLGEGRPLGEVAAENQMLPAAASRRLYKVKGRLRARWVQEHINTDGAPPACLPFLEEAGTVLAGLASPERAERFWEHVQGCDVCAEAIHDAQAASRRFGVTLAAVLALSGQSHKSAAAGFWGALMAHKAAVATVLATVLGLGALALMPLLMHPPATGNYQNTHAPSPVETDPSQGTSSLDPSTAPVAPSPAPSANLAPSASATRSQAETPAASGGGQNAVRPTDRYRCSWSGNVLCDKD